MGNLFIVYGDVLSKKMLSLADVIAMPAFNGKITPQDELTERFFELSGKRMKREIADKYGNEIMGKGAVRKIHESALIKTTLFVNAVYQPIWDLREPNIEKGLVFGYHNPLTDAYVLGYKSILLPYFGMSKTMDQNVYMIRRITRILLNNVTGRRREMDIYFVIPKHLGILCLSEHHPYS